MRITFGWELDGARWSPVGETRIGHVTAGPSGMLSILRTRLGLTGPDPTRAVRIAGFRRALIDAAHPWYMDAFEADPWAVSEQMLAWRDELVAAGWDGTAAADTSERLTALSRAEAVAAREAVAGDADALRGVAAELSAIASSSGGWPLGIDSVTIHEPVADYPAPWPAIFSALEQLGVAIEEAPAPSSLGELQIITAPTEWRAADEAARLLAAHPDAAVLATERTDVLDQELARRGLPRVGFHKASTQRAAAQAVPLFLSAVIGPIDVHAVAAFLNLTLDVPAASGEPDAFRSIGVVPAAVRRGFLDALVEQPGIGGPAWQEALRVLDEAAENTSGKETDAIRHRDLAHELDQMLRSGSLAFDESGECPVADIDRALDWLETRLRKLGHGLESAEFTCASGMAATARTVLEEFTVVGQQELKRIIDACTFGAESPLPGAGAGFRDVATGAARVPAGPGPLVWWGAIDGGAESGRRIWTPAESAALAEAGVDVPDPAALSRLTTTCRLAGLNRRNTVIAVIPERMDGAPVERHPLLTFAADHLSRRESGDGAPSSIEETLESAETPCDDLVEGSSWSHDGTSLELIPPNPRIPAVPDPVTRTVRPGTQLLPSRLSYSQISLLLDHGLEWLLQYQLGIRPGRVSEIPTGNRMIGTFWHAIVEDLVAKWNGDASRITEEAVKKTHERLLPHYASELTLPGNSRRLGALRATAIESITGMFRHLADHGFTVTGAEKEFDIKLELELRDPDGSGEPMTLDTTLTGYRDLDALAADDTPTVIDMKYSDSTTRYPKLVSSGRALQLAVYAQSIAQSAAPDSPGAEEGVPSRLPIDDVPVAFYELAHSRFTGRHPELGGSPGDDDRTWAGELWARAIRELENALSALAFEGRVVDKGNEICGNEHDFQKREKAAAKKADEIWNAGGYFPGTSVPYPKYDVITGLEADNR